MQGGVPQKVGVPGVPAYQSRIGAGWRAYIYIFFKRTIAYQAYQIRGGLTLRAFGLS
jgi:hypothetical protein